MRGISAAELAQFTGRAADEPAVAEAAAQALVVLDRYYVTDPWTDAHTLACKHVGRWLLQARQGDLVDGGDLGTVYLPDRMKAVDRLIDRRCGFA